MRNFLEIDETPPALDRSFKTVTKLRRELPTDIQMESIPHNQLPSLAEEIHAKTPEAAQNTDLNIQEFLEINKALQSIMGELVNNESNLTEINEGIKKDSKKLKQAEDDPTYSEEQRQLYKDSLDDLNTEKQAKLEILSQNRKDASCKNKTND